MADGEGAAVGSTVPEQAVEAAEGVTSVAELARAFVHAVREELRATESSALAAAGSYARW